MLILVIAFGALVSAGLPLVLTLAGLTASAGSLVLLTHFFPISIWAMNFAMMFSLALGVDYALFLVVRYRAARQQRSARDAIAETMDTAGKAVLLSGVTMLISLSAVLLVPSPSFRSAAGGIMLSVGFVLAATLTLLPLALFTLDAKLNRFSLPWVRPVAPGRGGSLLGGNGSGVNRWPGGSLPWCCYSRSLLPCSGSVRRCRRSRCFRRTPPREWDTLEATDAFGVGAPGVLQVVVDSDDTPAAVDALSGDRGVAGVLPAEAGSRRQSARSPPGDPNPRALRSRTRRDHRPPALSAPGLGAPRRSSAENTDLKAQLDRSTPW